MFSLFLYFFLVALIPIWFFQDLYRLHVFTRTNLRHVFQHCLVRVSGLLGGDGLVVAESVDVEVPGEKTHLSKQKKNRIFRNQASLWFM